MKPVLLREGFEAPGYENEGWVETVDIGCALVPGFAAESPDKGSYVLKAHSLNDDSEYAYATYTLEGVTNQLTNKVSAYIRLVDHGLSNSQQVYAIALCTSSGADVAVVQYYFTNYELNLMFRCLSAGQWIYHEVIPVTTDWYLVDFDYDIEKFRYKFKLNNKTYFKGDIDPEIWVPQSIKKVKAGIFRNFSNAPATLQVASVEWDD
ncbi:MAG: hypothetical protein ACFFCW_14295 [Candidatus Hodarchaeota archaeon]